MKEAVELIEAIEETGLVYAYGENYCYMAAPREMRTSVSGLPRIFSTKLYME